MTKPKKDVSILSRSCPLANEVENVCVGGILGESEFECKALFPNVINIYIFPTVKSALLLLFYIFTYC